MAGAAQLGQLRPRHGLRRDLAKKNRLDAIDLRKRLSFVGGDEDSVVVLHLHAVRLDWLHVAFLARLSARCHSQGRLRDGDMHAGYVCLKPSSAVEVFAVRTTGGLPRKRKRS